MKDLLYYYFFGFWYWESSKEFLEEVKYYIICIYIVDLYLYVYGSTLRVCFFFYYIRDSLQFPFNVMCDQFPMCVHYINIIFVCVSITKYGKWTRRKITREIAKKREEWIFSCKVKRMQQWIGMSCGNYCHGVQSDDRFSEVFSIVFF